MIAAKITGTGSYIPEERILNQDFLAHQFYKQDGEPIDQDGQITIDKFQAITGIRERRYASPGQQTSDLGTIAAQRAIETSGVNVEELDGLIMAHNFGNVPHGKIQSDILPSLATRIKHNLGIKNPECIAFDILYGCPGWLEAFIMAETYIKAGRGTKFLVVAGETLSRKLDKHDRDSMIFADGAGAAVLEATQPGENSGVLASASQTFTSEEAYYLYYDVSNNPDVDHSTRFIKMRGHKIFEFALTHVPAAMKKCMDRSGVSIDEVKKVLIHQANEKMDEAIIKRFYRLYQQSPPQDIMPMSIDLLGNSSVATVPTLLDNLLKRNLDDHQIEKGDVVLMASVGSGMSINAVAYRI